MSDFAIYTEGLVRTFGAVRAVDGVDLAVSPGEVYGFLGPNGAGKTTLVRILITLLLPTKGRAVIAGHDVVADPGAVRLAIGAAMQEAALDDKQTGRELLHLQGRLYGLTGREAVRRTDELMSMVDIGGAIDRRIGTYSGGMKRRLDVAASLVHNPQVLFLDEPTTGLDPISRVRVWEEVKLINQQLGMTIFLTTHYLDEADALADRVGIISNGKLAAEGTPMELKHSIGSDVVIARLPGDADAATASEVVEKIPGVEGIGVHGDTLTIRVDSGTALIGSIAVAMNEAKIEVQELTLRTPTLDDVFLHFTGGRLLNDAGPQETRS